MTESNFKHHISHWSRHLLDQLLPPRCLACGGGVQDAGRICSDCWRQLDFLQGPACACCGYPFDFGSDGALCAACLKSLPPFRRARAALRYDDGSRHMIISFKHGDRTDYGDFFAQLLSQASQGLELSSALVIPVPLHKQRLRKRRYNQAAVLAQNFARKKHFDYIPDMLVRHRYTPPQEGNYACRKRNVAGAFNIREKCRQIIAERAIIVIDDVYTTGAGSVDILTLARVC